MQHLSTPSSIPQRKPALPRPLCTPALPPPQHCVFCSPCLPLPSHPAQNMGWSNVTVKPVDSIQALSCLSGNAARQTAPVHMHSALSSRFAAASSGVRLLQPTPSQQPHCRPPPHQASSSRRTASSACARPLPRSCSCARLSARAASVAPLTATTCTTSSPAGQLRTTLISASTPCSEGKHRECNFKRNLEGWRRVRTAEGLLEGCTC